MRPAMNGWLGSATAVTAVAAVGGLCVDTSSDWYRSLDLPPWQPPPEVFGPVWTALYAGIAYAGGAAWRNADGPRRRRLAMWGGSNLVLNAAWTAVFFRGHTARGGVAVLVPLLATGTGFAIEASAVSRPAAAAVTPYLAWSAFATALDIAIALRN